MFYVLLFVVSVVVTLGGCALFTNAVEWLGKRLGVSEGAVGSIFAAIGTTLPETSIPIIAIFFGRARMKPTLDWVPFSERRSCSALSCCRFLQSS
jgi:cation:H+ antiporter